jgi:Spy/CpxP family protein refolding chaperone
MRMPKKCLLSLVVAGLLVLPAVAQRPGANPFVGGGKIFLLQSEDVQKELKLTDTQIDKVKEMAEKQKNAFKDIPKDKEERLKKIEEIRKEMQEREKQIAELLKPEQAKRLDQIMLQQQGAAGLLSPKVVEDLKITDEQKTKITEAITDSAKELGDLLKGGKIDPAELRKKLAEQPTKTMEKAINVLTPDQKKQWKEMVGEPFKGKLFGNNFGLPTPRKPSIIE